jgi:queuine tRNA-ribosyltransferase
MSFSFHIEKKMPGRLGRIGTITTPHGALLTPAFVTVGTKATVKSLTSDIVKECGAQVVLANTYHLYLQPGEDVVKKAGGLGKMMNWAGPTMTDSGGFQVFSLGAAYGKGISKLLKKDQELLLPEAGGDDEGKARLVQIDSDGVMFRSHIDGSAHYFTPEKSIQIQHDLGADIIFAFDECTSPTETMHYQQDALDRTHRWAKRSLAEHVRREAEKKAHNSSLPQALFGIVQGGRHENLRKESAQAIADMNVDGVHFDGFGIGGSFAKEDMMTAVKWVNEILPEEKPRHLLGIGEPLDLFGAVEQGCDLFDCVAPTRQGRNGTLYTRHGKIHITNAEYTSDTAPIDAQCGCSTCAHYSRAYISHLFRAKEMLAGTLASTHNLYFIVKLVDNMRQAILEDRYDEFKEAFLKDYVE